MKLEDFFDKEDDYTEDDAAFLAKEIGDYDDKCFEEDGDFWEDSVLNDYAKYIQNYLYTYKDSARQIDPNIDPSEEHIGPMAQDIEKVNPACVVEENGVKEVDAGRVAMMNAGAIADLARKMEELAAELKSLKGE